MKRVALYIRVSTSKQDTENQRRELQAVADRSGWKIVKVYEDAGITAKGRDQRPALDAMMKAVNLPATDFEDIMTSGRYIAGTRIVIRKVREALLAISGVVGRRMGLDDRPVIGEPRDQIRIADEGPAECDQIGAAGIQRRLGRDLVKSSAPDHRPLERRADLPHQIVAEMRLVELAVLHVSRRH